MDNQFNLLPMLQNSKKINLHRSKKKVQKVKENMGMKFTRSKKDKRAGRVTSLSKRKKMKRR
jgi:hypothetical protein